MQVAAFVCGNRVGSNKDRMRQKKIRDQSKFILVTSRGNFILLEMFRSLFSHLFSHHVAIVSHAAADKGHISVWLFARPLDSAKLPVVLNGDSFATRCSKLIPIQPMFVFTGALNKIGVAIARKYCHVSKNYKCVIKSVFICLAGVVLKLGCFVLRSYGKFSR